MLTAHLRAIASPVHRNGKQVAAHYAERARVARALSSEAPNEVLGFVHQTLACRYAALATELHKNDHPLGIRVRPTA